MKLVKRLQNRKEGKKGFTLVELIVVLVILAILAALLIPALTGYINKANEKKVIAEARMVLMAGQTTLSESYATRATDTTEVVSATVSPLIRALAEEPAGKFTITYNLADYTIVGMDYTSDGYKATYAKLGADKGTWEIAKGTAIATDSVTKYAAP